MKHKFSFQFSVFSFQFARMFFFSDSCDSLNSWFTIFAFLKRVSFTNRLPYSRDLPERFSEMGTTKPVVTVLSLQSFE